MNKVILLALLVPAMAFGQITEDFESGTAGNWIQVPEGRWTADTSNSISGSFSLHHSFDNTIPGNDLIAIPVYNLLPGAGTTSWSFRIRHGCDPSSANKWALVLINNSDDYLQEGYELMNGFITGVNVTGSDDTLRLWKVKQGEYIPLINSRINWQNDIGSAEAVKICIERSQEGNWNLSVFRLSGGTVKQPSTASDNELFGSGLLIVSYTYTATRDRLLWLDDVIVEGISGEDAGPPPVNAELADVIITEIMADPSPSVSLPEKEYVEIRNMTSFPLILDGWSLMAGDHKINIPSATVGADGFAVITSIRDTSEFYPYGNVIGMKSFPSLTDRGMTLCLLGASGELVHGVDYTDKWYISELKKSGGWSLEMIDSEYPFHYEDNWRASCSGSGGTPGSTNSVSGRNRDISFQGVVNVFPDDSLTVKIYFSEPVFGVSTNGSGFTIDGKSIDSVVPDDMLYRTFRMKPGIILERKKIYVISVPEDLCDFSGNRAEDRLFSFGIPEKASAGDILFNEILFNPLPGVSDFIEFYNNSDKIIDAARLLLVSVNSSGDTSSLYQLSGEHRCILPGTYYTVTTDKSSIISAYIRADPSAIFETTSLPSMPDDKGHLILFNRELDLIDEIVYNDDMHFPLLSGDEGVTLEKCRTGSNSSERQNWHSAAETAGWGTPGMDNSVTMEEQTTDEMAVFSSTKISPDNDGFEDFLMIDLNLSGYENVVSIRIFDETGTFVERLAENFLCGPEASIRWDGTLLDGTLAETGIYIILVSVFDGSGKSISFKKVCAVMRN